MHSCRSNSALRGDAEARMRDGHFTRTPEPNIVAIAAKVEPRRRRAEGQGPRTEARGPFLACLPPSVLCPLSSALLPCLLLTPVLLLVKQPMNTSIRFRLFLMMILEFFIWGC